VRPIHESLFPLHGGGGLFFFLEIAMNHELLTLAVQVAFLVAAITIVVVVEWLRGNL
jgi:hypothetical protein